MAKQAFSRIGNPMRVPVSPTSGSTMFSTSGKIPMASANLTFQFVNLLPVDLWLEGFADSDSFTAVTEGRGWPIMARSASGVYTSKRPKLISVQAFASPGLPLPVEGVDGWTWANCFLNLIYGEGD
jgi:hypothetical protein